MSGKKSNTAKVKTALVALRKFDCEEFPALIQVWNRFAGLEVRKRISDKTFLLFMDLLKACLIGSGITQERWLDAVACAKSTKIKERV